MCCAKRKLIFGHMQSESPDQPAHMCSLIRSFTAESLDTIECIDGE